MNILAHNSPRSTPSTSVPLFAPGRAQSPVAFVNGGDTLTKGIRSTLATFRAHGFPVARGFGRQWALERGWWGIDGRPAQMEERERVQAAKNSQLSLFGSAT